MRAVSLTLMSPTLDGAVSPAQEHLSRLRAREQMAYFCRCSAQITGVLDPSRLNSALTAVVSRHQLDRYCSVNEILRLTPGVKESLAVVTLPALAADLVSLQWLLADLHAAYHEKPLAEPLPTPYDVATNVPIFEKVSSDGVDGGISQHTSLGDINVLGAHTLEMSQGPVPIIAAAYPAPFTGLESNVNDRSHAWTGEVNFASRKFNPRIGRTRRVREGQFSFIAGANYYAKSDKWNPLQVEQNIPGSAYAISIFAGQSTKAYAGYGEGTYQLTDKLSIIGGLRYTSEQRGATGSEVSGIQTTGQYYNWGSRTFEDVTQRVSALYSVTPKTNVYFTYSTGFKSGNFIATSIPFAVTPAQCNAENVAAAGSCAFPPVLLPETNTAFEGGIKSEPKSWLQLDAAVFHYKLSNIQIESYTNVCLKNPCPPNPLVQLSGYSNAASASMYGGEFNANARVTNDLFIRGGVSLLNATFSSYENASWFVPAPGDAGMIQTPTVSADGKQVPRAPRATLDLSGTYTRNLHLGVFWFTADAYASSRMYYDVGNVFSQPTYATLGLRASFSPAGAPKVTASLWGYNVTDARVILGTILGSTGANVSFAAPTTYGLISPWPRNEVPVHSVSAGM